MGESVGRTVEQVRALVGWVGTGRKLTQTGRVTLADARALVEVLDTGDRMDPVIGDRTFKTKSSEELYTSRCWSSGRRRHDCCGPRAGACCR
jgi:hypothetical protein